MAMTMLRFGPNARSCERHGHTGRPKVHFISANVPRRSVVQVGNEHHSGIIGLATPLVPTPASSQP